MALIGNRDQAAERERQAAMPSPQSTARRGIVVGRYMGMSERHAALMVTAAAGAAIASASVDPTCDVSWLQSISDEAMRIYQRCVDRETV